MTPEVIQEQDIQEQVIQKENTLVNEELLGKEIIEFIRFMDTMANTGHDNTVNTVVNTVNTNMNNIELEMERRIKKYLVNLSPDSKYFTMLYEAMLYTRDIVNGRGAYQLAYIQMYEWNKYYPQLVKNAIYRFVIPIPTTTKTITTNEHQQHQSKHALGSWKDIKYFLTYCKMRGLPVDHELFVYCYKLVNEQLKKDIDNKMLSLSLSLVAKWIPREKSKKHGWLFHELAKHYYKSDKNGKSDKKSIRWKKMEYRKICSNLNRALDTVQIKQTSNQWSTINHNKTTSLTLMKQMNAFLRTWSNTNTEDNKLDRENCSKKFKYFLNR
jgi:hypothetical protein